MLTTYSATFLHLCLQQQSQLFHPQHEAGAALIADALRVLPLPIAPVAVSHVDGPVLEVRRVAEGEQGAATALDIRLTAGFRYMQLRLLRSCVFLGSVPCLF